MRTQTAPSDMQATTERTWSIQEFASHFDITPRTIRFYEDKGLLSPDRQAGSRIFCQKDHVRLSEIMRAKRLGFSLDDIKIVMDVIDGKVHDKATLLEHKKNFESVIKSLRRRRKDIDALNSDLAALCGQIDNYVETASEPEGAFKFADAYEAAFRRHFEGDGFEAPYTE